jgi:hypothetical protein
MHAGRGAFFIAARTAATAFAATTTATTTAGRTALAVLRRTAFFRGRHNGSGKAQGEQNNECLDSTFHRLTSGRVCTPLGF